MRDFSHAVHAVQAGRDTFLHLQVRNRHRSCSGTTEHKVSQALQPHRYSNKACLYYLACECANWSSLLTHLTQCRYCHWTRQHAMLALATLSESESCRVRTHAPNSLLCSSLLRTFHSVHVVQSTLFSQHVYQMLGINDSCWHSPAVNIFNRGFPLRHRWNEP